MAQHCSLQITELGPLLEQLAAGRERLEQLINQLSGLHIRVELPGMDASELELTLAGQELILRRKPEKATGAERQRIPVIAEDARMRIAAGLARSMADEDAAVLIQGATGTGKSLFARLIHHQGKRTDGPLVSVPCSLLNQPDGMTRWLEFRRAADNGTLILEDMEELEPAAQQTLSRLLQQPAACRLISLTCADPDELVRRKEFSPALLEQLRHCHICLPDLSRRGADIELLARHYCRQLCVDENLEEKHLAPEYLDLLALYSWPGNVRELINTLKQSLLCCRNQKTLYARDLPAHIRMQTLPLAAARKKGL